MRHGEIFGEATQLLRWKASISIADAGDLRTDLGAQFFLCKALLANATHTAAASRIPTPAWPPHRSALRRRTTLLHANNPVCRHMQNLGRSWITRQTPLQQGRCMRRLPRLN